MPRVIGGSWSVIPWIGGDTSVSASYCTITNDATGSTTTWTVDDASDVWVWANSNRAASWIMQEAQYIENVEANLAQPIPGPRLEQAVDQQQAATQQYNLNGTANAMCAQQAQQDAFYEQQRLQQLGAQGLTDRERYEAEIQRRAQDLACARAEELLVAMLDKQQRDDYQKFKRFDVIAPPKDRRYRITKNWAGNVFLMEGDPLRGQERMMVKYCIHPTKAIPVCDSMLAQKFMLECGEEEAFLKTANATRLAA